MGYGRHHPSDTAPPIRPCWRPSQRCRHAHAVMTQRDLHQQMLAAQKPSTERLTKGDGESMSPLSSLSTNESLFLAASGWEPLEICCGAAVFGMRQDTVSTWGALQDDRASEALAAAMATAVERLEGRCVRSGVHGVVGTEITTEIQPRYIAVSLIGTGVRPVHSSKPPGSALHFQPLSTRVRPAPASRMATGRRGVGMPIHQGLSARTHSGGRPKSPERGAREPDLGACPSTI